MAKHGKTRIGIPLLAAALLGVAPASARAEGPFFTAPVGIAFSAGPVITYEDDAPAWTAPATALRETPREKEAASGNDVAENLLRLVKDTRFTAVAVNKHNNDAFSSGSTKARAAGMASLKDLRPEQTGGALSYTLKPGDDWTLSFSGAYVREKNVALETAGDRRFGFEKTATISTGVGASVQLAGGYVLSADAVAASTTGSPGEASLITGASRLYSFGAAVALEQGGYRFAVEKPLRVYAGSAHADMPAGTDAHGNAIYENRKISLNPSGSETDFGFSYRRPVDFGGAGSFSLAWRHDADNISGAEDGVAMLRYSASF